MAFNIQRILYLLLLLFQGVHLDGNRNMQRKLLMYLRNQSNETLDLLPVVNYNEVVNVKFGIMLIKIKDVNAKEQTIQVHLWITQSWYNPFLTWDPSEFGNISWVNIKASEIWVPDIVLYNNVDEQDRTGGGRETYKTLVTLYNNGTNFWSSPALFKAICEIKVDYFPLDQQVCRLKFGSWTYNTDKVSLTSIQYEFPNDHYIRNGEWGIQSARVRENNMSYLDRFGEYMDVTMTIHMDRQFWDYLINLVIPCLMISCMTFLGFILPPESGERIGLSITVLLAMTVFQQLTSEIMPSYDFPLLGQYYFATILEIGLALLGTTIILNFYHRTNRHMPKWLRIVILDWLARVVFLHESAEKCTKPRQKTLKRGIRDNIDTIINNGYVIGEHPLNNEMTAGGGGRGGPYEMSTTRDSVEDGLNHNRGANPSTSANKPQDQNVMKLTLGSIGSELSPNTHDVDGMFTDESGAVVSEDEMRMRHQQWTLAAKVLDRFALWMSLVGGLATFLGIFLRAPRFWTGNFSLDV